MPETATNTLPFEIRPITPGDVPFIYDTWLRAMREALAPNVRGAPAGRFFDGVRARVDMLLARSRTCVAHAKGAPDHILGFATGEHDVLHFAYVKRPFRRNGVFRALWRELRTPRYATAWTPDLGALCIEKPGWLTYVGTDVPHFMRAVPA